MMNGAKTKDALGSEATVAVGREMEEWVGPGVDEKAASLENAASATDKKEEAILEACRKRDLCALRQLAESPGGFLSDAIRQQACECPSDGVGCTVLRLTLS